MPDIPTPEMPFHFDISRVGEEWWLELPWTILVCNSKESAEEALAIELKKYREKLDRIDNPTSAAELIENGGFYETAITPPRLTDESGKEIPWN